MHYPSYFSRIYDTADAFRKVTEYMRNGINVPPSVEARIVETCLNIINLLYMPNDRVEILSVELATEIRTPFDERLNNIILEDARSLFDPSSGDKMGVILVDGMVIGGLSPLTVVYSNPDIHRNHTQIFDGCVRRLGSVGNLLARDYLFIQYLFSLATNGLLPDVIRDYIYESVRADDSLRMKLYTDIIDFQTFSKMTDKDGNIITVNGHPIYRNTAENIVAESGYLIYSLKLPSADETVRSPLVLSQHGIPNATYIGDIRWKPGCNPTPNDQTLDSRILPMTGIRYPYLTLDDFLEEKIIECISTNGTISPSFLYQVDEEHYIALPLRKVFFDYFTPEDIDRLLSIRCSEESYHVKLRIPVKAGTVEFHKVYSPESILMLNLDYEFNIAVTPMLVTEDLPHHVISMQNNCECVIQFYNSEDNIETQPETALSDIDSGARRLSFARTVGKWDYMTLKLMKSENEKAAGILFPKFRNHVPLIPDRKIFSIIVNDRNISVLQSDAFGPMFQLAKPLAICKDSSLVSAMASTPMFDSIMQQCFIYIGDKHNSNMMLDRVPLAVNMYLPHDTITMLGGGNIAFDTSKPALNRWMQISVPTVGNHKNIFFEEIAYLIRFSCIDQGLNQLPEIKVELPLWMNEANKESFRLLWKSAFFSMGIPADNIDFIDSHGARFAYSAHEVGTGDTIHMDIDAYHTVIACRNTHTDGFDYKVYDFGINNLYGLTIPYQHSNDNVYIRRVVGSGQRDPELMTMLHEHKDCLDVLERAIEIHDYSCFEIPEFRVPYTLFIEALMDAVIDFANSRNLGDRIGIKISGYGIKFLSGLSCGRDLMYDLYNVIRYRKNQVGIDNRRIDISILDIERQTDYLPLVIPVMIAVEDEADNEFMNLQSPDKIRDFLMNGKRQDVLGRINEETQSIVERNLTEDSGIASVDALMAVLDHSYKTCVHEYVDRCFHNGNGHPAAMPDVRFWPYVHSLSWLALNGYRRLT